MSVKEQFIQAPLTRFLLEKASRGRIPINGTFELSPVCNFNCRMCYVRKTAEQVRASERPIMTLERWLELARQAREEGLLYLLLTGGEPFLWPDFWPLYEQLAQMGFILSVNTNGSLLDEAAVERLRRRPPVRLNITLYGASDDTYEALCRTRGGYSRVARNIDRLLAAGIQVKLNCSLIPENAGDLAAIHAFAAERKLILETNTYMFPPVRRDPACVGRNERFTPAQAAHYNLERYRLLFGQEEYETYLQGILAGLAPPPGLEDCPADGPEGGIRCRAGNAAFWVTWDGWLTPCGMMPEPRVDLSAGDFAPAWRELTRLSDEVRVSAVCSACPDKAACHACAAMALAETGSAAGLPKYLCEMVAAMRTEARALLEKRSVNNGPQPAGVMDEQKWGGK